MMKLTTRSFLRFGVAVAGLALTGVTLLGGASAASAKTGNYGYEYQCMETDVDWACSGDKWIAGQAGGGGTGLGYAPIASLYHVDHGKGYYNEKGDYVGILVRNDNQDATEEDARRMEAEEGFKYCIASEALHCAL